MPLGINKELGREGAMFSSPSRDIECLDNESVEDRFFYALTNPVKDGLVNSMSQWKGFSSYKALALGKAPVFTYINWTAWYKAGGLSSGKSPGAFAKTVKIKYTPLPGTEHLTEHQRCSRIRKQCKIIEQEFREQRKNTPMGPKKLETLNHRDRPVSLPVRSKKPLCHCKDKHIAKAFKAAFKDFLNAYRQASAYYRSGLYDTIFPPGSLKPPLIEIATT